MVMLVQNYIISHWIEIVGAILSLVYLYLSIKQKISLWFFGFLSSAFYIVVFFQTKFYADMSLQFYYLFISVYGWFEWKYGNVENKSELPVSKISTALLIRLGWVSALIYIVYYLILSKLTDSTIPKADSLVGMLSVVGTWMLARKLLENWIVWIIADGIATGLFIFKGLYPTATLFVIYTAMAFVGYRQWKRSI